MTAIEYIENYTWFINMFSRTDMRRVSHIIKAFESKEMTNRIETSFSARDKRDYLVRHYDTAVLYLNIYSNQVFIIDFLSYVENKKNGQNLYRELFRFIFYLNSSDFFNIKRITGCLAITDAPNRKKLIHIYSKASYNTKSCKVQFYVNDQIYTKDEILDNLDRFQDDYIEFSINIQ